MLRPGSTILISLADGTRLRGSIEAASARIVMVRLVDQDEVGPGDEVDVTIAREGESPFTVPASVTERRGPMLVVELAQDPTASFGRRFLRVEDTVRVFLSRIDRAGNILSTVATTSSDISAGGLSVGPDADLSPGETLRVRIAIEQPVVVKAVVVRCDQRGFGLCFEQLADADEQRLVQHVNALQVRSRQHSAALTAA
jgi:protein involved in polysaccharide export with SLBB domain